LRVKRVVFYRFFHTGSRGGSARILQLWSG
jgi:hypothetical protein